MCFTHIWVWNVQLARMRADKLTATMLLLSASHERSWRKHRKPKEKLFITSSCQCNNNSGEQMRSWFVSEYYGLLKMLLCTVSISRTKCIWSMCSLLSYTVALRKRKKKAQRAVSDLRTCSLLWQIIMPQRLTDVPALYGNDSSLSLFALAWFKNVKTQLALPPLPPIYFISIL